MKATKNFGGGALGKILSSINENLGESHRAEQWWEIEMSGRSQAWLSGRQHQLLPWSYAECK